MLFIEGRANERFKICYVCLVLNLSIAQGLPIISAIFHESKPTFPEQLFLISPVQILLFTTLGIGLMRHGTAAPTEEIGPLQVGHKEIRVILGVANIHRVTE